MDSLLVDRAVLGTERHLTLTGDDYGWADDVSPGAWHLSGGLKPNTRCLDTVARLARVEVPSPPDRFVRSLRALGPSGPALPPWRLLMPAREHSRYVRSVVSASMVAMGSPSRTYFEGTWWAGSAVTGRLVPAWVDVAAYDRLVAEGTGNVAALVSFKPGPDGFAAPVVYDRLATATGRLTVTSGPQILTLKREHRSVIASRHGAAGRIVSLDFSALEARIVLYESGAPAPADPDLYGTLASEMGRPRPAVKGAVISEIYGSNKQQLGQRLGMSGPDLDAFVAQVAARFDVRGLRRRVRAQYLSLGHITNRFGRRLDVSDPLDHVLVNYFCQSTGVDVSMMGFARVLDRLDDEAPRTVPLFLLHDALLLDVPCCELDAVSRVGSVNVPGYDPPFYMKMEQVG